MPRAVRARTVQRVRPDADRQAMYNTPRWQALRRHVL